MPELPEVETTLRGIEPYIDGARLLKIEVRNDKLRWPVPTAALRTLHGQKVSFIRRRAKYILIGFDQSELILHLGMSGSLRVLQEFCEPQKHDHIDLCFDNGTIVRFNDPRRFGCLLFNQDFNTAHDLIAHLGPEPLHPEFCGDYLFDLSRKRSQAVKNFIMDGKIVVGVGNIYASESLYMAGIRPTMSAGRLSRVRYHQLAEAIKFVLEKAIQAGGTTLNDFAQTDGKPGYFSQELQVYGRSGQACIQCGADIKSKVIGQRNTFFCTVCQSF